MTEEREPKVAIVMKALDEAVVAAHLAQQLSEAWRGTVMLHHKSRWGRSHLRLHHDRNGYFVRCGRRGGCKMYLGRCEITYLDREPTLFQFTLADHDRFEAEQTRRWLTANGLEA